MSKSQVIEKLIDFYEKSTRAVKKVNKNKKGVNDFADQLTPTDVKELFNIDKTSRL